MPQRNLSTFHLDDLLLGIDVARVREVVRGQPITPVPLAPPFIHGLINLRGSILTALDLRSLLSLPARTDMSGDSVNVIVDVSGAMLCLVADRMGDVVEVEAREFHGPPPTLAPEIRRLVDAAYFLDDRMLLVLNGSSIAEATSERSASPSGS